MQLHADWHFKSFSSEKPSSSKPVFVGLRLKFLPVLVIGGAPVADLFLFLMDCEYAVVKGVEVYPASTSIADKDIEL